MVHLGVNLDHVATLRQVRNASYPVPADMLEALKQGGASNVTLHLREDRRHIQDSDVFEIAQRNYLPLNLEMAATHEMFAIAEKIRPHTLTIVPEKRLELTTEGGLKFDSNLRSFEPRIRQLVSLGVSVSAFVDPDEMSMIAAQEMGFDAIELHTGTYAHLSERAEKIYKDEVLRLKQAAQRAYALGLVVHAGHGLTLQNVAQIARLPHMHSLQIGHSIVARALSVGMQNAVREMKNAMG